MTASFLGEDYLEVRGLTVDFDGFKAVGGVDLSVPRNDLLVSPAELGVVALP